MFSIWKHSVMKLSCNRIMGGQIFTCVQTQSIIRQQVPAIHFTGSFHTSSLVRLRTLFSDDEQLKIASFINDAQGDESIYNRKLRPILKIIESRPEKGPVENIDDLLGKYCLSSTAAVSLCYAILKSGGSSRHQEKIHAKRRVLPRKINSLRKAISPDIPDPKFISRFTAVTVADSFVSFSVFKGLKSNWQSQQVIDWNAIDTSDTSVTDFALKFWKMLLPDEIYVVYSVPTRGLSLNQNRFYGAAVSVMCGKNNYNDDVSQKIFHVTGRGPARHFNLIVGNEMVSTQSMVSHKLEPLDIYTLDDHVYSRSLSEVNFSSSALTKYNAFDDDMKEPLCQSLLLGKSFIDILKELHLENEKKL